MLKPFASYLSRLDAAYRDASAFVGLKARLLAAITVLFVFFIPLNIAKILWFQPPFLGPADWHQHRGGLCRSDCTARFVNGRLAAAGNGLALAMVLTVNTTVLTVGIVVQPLHPLSAGIQVFAFDLVFLIFAIVFASRQVATAVFAIMVATHLAFHWLVLHEAKLPPALDYSADTLLRDGLLVMFLLFGLGITLTRILHAAHQRSEESLRETRTMNEKLEETGLGPHARVGNLERSGRRRLARQKRISGQHEPRNPHAAERHHRVLRPAHAPV